LHGMPRSHHFETWLLLAPVERNQMCTVCPVQSLTRLQYTISRFAGPPNMLGTPLMVPVSPGAIVSVAAATFEAMAFVNQYLLLLCTTMLQPSLLAPQTPSLPRVWVPWSAS